MRRLAGIADLGPIILYLSAKLLIGFGVLFLSSRLPGVTDFSLFNQLLIFFALVSVVATAGLQNGLIREAASALASPARFTALLAAAAAALTPVAALLIAVGLLAGVPISRLLLGTPTHGWLVSLIAALAVCAGLGQALCAVMTGTGRSRRAMMIQTLSLAVAGGLTLWRLLAGDVTGAIIGYAAGSALLPLLAAVSMGYLRASLTASFTFERAMLRVLSRFSGAYLVTSCAMPLTLFLLRAAYRAHFGEAMLADWLAANRISDTLTQFLGLYMAQVHLPRLAAAKAPAEAALAFRRSILAAGGLMAAGALVFLLGANFWISLLLSARFIPARGFIVIYVVGDCLRTLPAALMFTALARRRTGTYAGLELLNAAIFAGVTLGLMAMGFGLAPAFAYIAAGLGVAGAGLALLRPIRQDTVAAS